MLSPALSQALGNLIPDSTVVAVGFLSAVVMASCWVLVRRSLSSLPEIDESLIDSSRPSSTSTLWYSGTGALVDWSDRITAADLDSVSTDRVRDYLGEMHSINISDYELDEAFDDALDHVGFDSEY